MCGFAGVISWDEKYRVTRDTLEKMSRAIAHRGPDGEGYYLTHEQEAITPDSPQAALAFRRLAILDPDPRSNQPFQIGSLTLLFNGEIYNFKDLKSEISNLRPDYQWRTSGDTEVLLMAYEFWREKCVEKLNGMFAFAIWDEQKKELFLARDRMGQKPLYYSLITAHRDLIRINDGYTSGRPLQVIFGSELSALREFSQLNPSVKRHLPDYLALGYFPADTTIYENVTKLMPGSFASMNSNDVRTACYFDAACSAERSSDCVETTRELLLRSIERQMISDVPVGCFLSGGIDSSIIALGMQRAANRSGDAMTFSIRFGDARYDESEYAQAVASHLGTKHHTFTVEHALGDDLARVAAAFGEPFADSSALPTHYLSQQARQFVKVALSGDGGDELFGGYDRYRALELTRTLSWLPLNLIRLARVALGRIGIAHPKSRRARARRLLESVALPVDARYPSYVQLFPPSMVNELLQDQDYAQFGYFVRNSYSRLLVGRDPVTAAVALDRQTYLPNDLLTKVDRCSMMHGLEVRSPFMDHDLVQFAAGLNTDQLLKGGPKRMLREAFAKDLPDFVFKRKKMGFAVPIGEWFRGELRGMLRENLFASNSFVRAHFNIKVVERLVEEHEQERVDHSQRLYALLMLELWWQQQGEMTG